MPREQHTNGTVRKPKLQEEKEQRHDVESEKFKIKLQGNKLSLDISTTPGKYAGKIVAFYLIGNGESGLGEQILEALEG